MRRILQNEQKKSAIITENRIKKERDFINNNNHHCYWGRTKIRCYKVKNRKPIVTSFPLPYTDLGKYFHTLRKGRKPTLTYNKTEVWGRTGNYLIPKPPTTLHSIY